MRQSQVIDCSINRIVIQGPTGSMGSSGQGLANTGPTGPTGPIGMTGPAAAPSTYGINYTQTFTGGIINQSSVTITPTLPSNFPPGIYLVMCNMQITAANVDDLSHVRISYTGLLSDDFNTTNYSSVTEFNR